MCVKEMRKKLSKRMDSLESRKSRDSGVYKYLIRVRERFSKIAYYPKSA